MSGFMFWRSVGDAASAEALASPLPGYYDGPADAYRHIVGTAELRRRFGFGTAYAIATGNEVLGTHERNQPPELRQMDDHNNAIGFSMGAGAKTYEEVVRRARAAIEAAIAHGGDGSDGTPRWQGTWGEPRGRTAAERGLPVQWPDGIPSARDYPFGAEQFGTNGPNRTMTPRQREAATLERLRDLPTGEWSEADVRAVIGSRPYTNSSAPEHRAWRARAQQYFEERTRQGGASNTSQTEEKACGGIASVRAYTRSGPSGPVQVSAHSRTVTCG
ncbi:MAG: hypothetical protein K2X49_17005 [Acetobacteraceae bacterium]|nr:hypothetical protein [Acetobacteraceae bacterium]